jgi:hypothetical protein
VPRKGGAHETIDVSVVAGDAQSRRIRNRVNNPTAAMDAYGYRPRMGSTVSGFEDDKDRAEHRVGSVRVAFRPGGVGAHARSRT